MIKEVKGNLLEAKEDIIAHQVNCIGVMGAGVAKQIKQKLLSKEEFNSYANACHSKGSDLLGMVQWFINPKRNGQYIANLFGENIPTGKGLDTDYNALECCLRKLFNRAAQKNLTVALPGFLGCGLAGGDWKLVHDMISNMANIYRVNVVIYYIPESVKMLWQEFGDVPMDPETECIEIDWHGFKAGTNRFDIWHWFEETFEVSVEEDLMFTN